MGYLEDKQRNGRLTKQEHDELLELINAALDAANEYTKALCSDFYEGNFAAAADADDATYRAVLVWLGEHTLPETTNTSGTSAATGTAVPTRTTRTGSRISALRPEGTPAMTTHADAETIRYTADVVVLSGDRVLLIKRAHDPYAGRWAFPGGHVDRGETSHDAAVRELEEETGISADPSVLEQVGVFDAPGRDPRGRYVTVVYSGALLHAIPPTASDDASEARWWPLNDLPPLAFDHAAILRRVVGEGSEVQP